jgi:hypothetical protein
MKHLGDNNLHETLWENKLLDDERYPTKTEVKIKNTGKQNPG